MRTSSLLTTTATLGLALAVPTAAQAAESFVGVTAGTKLVSFTSDTLPATSAPKAISGLAAGEQLVALDRTPAGALVGLGSNGTLYAVDAAKAAATVLATTSLGAIPAGEAATFAVSADGASARVIAAGRDRDVALPSGQVTRDAAAVPYAAGDAGSGPAAPAVDLTAAGTLEGVEAVRGVRASVDATGAHTLGTLAKERLHGATRTTIAADGTQYVLTGAPVPGGQQSRILQWDPKTQTLKHQSSYLDRQLGAIAAMGAVADDTKAPTATVAVPKQTYAQAVARKGLRFVVKTSEAGQTVASARLGGKIKGFGFATATKAQRLEVHLSATTAHLAQLRGKRGVFHITVNDNAGNKKVLDVPFRLAR